MTKDFQTTHHIGYLRPNKREYSNLAPYKECFHIEYPFSKTLEAGKFRSVVILFYSRMLGKLCAMENIVHAFFIYKKNDGRVTAGQVSLH